MITKHILKTDFGVTVELHFNEETSQLNCVWEGLPKHMSKSQREKILSAYNPWRDQMLAAWAERTGKKTLVINLMNPEDVGPADFEQGNRYTAWSRTREKPMSLAEHIHAKSVEKGLIHGSAESRARKELRGKLSKIVKKAAQIAELLTDEDQEENLRVILEAKKANHVYITRDGRVEVPDHKTRMGAVALDLAYGEGRPRERDENLHVHATTEDFNALLDRFRQSKAAMRSVPAGLLETGTKAQDIATDKAENSGSEIDSMARDTSHSK